MKEKTFVVTHAKARSTLTITGQTLKEALQKEGLNPDIWKQLSPSPSEEEGDNGEDNETP